MICSDLKKEKKYDWMSQGQVFPLEETSKEGIYPC